jgi:hypothetical protein
MKKFGLDALGKSCKVSDTGFRVIQAFNGQFGYWRYSRVAAKVRCS